jgi:formamidopyrimidine-DNA glycosylase
VPELPEVEIAARNLRRWTAGRTILAARADPKGRRIFRPAAPARVTAALAGLRFGEVRRRGKHLMLELSGDGRKVGLLSHLGMTGKWLLREGGAPPPSHARLSLDLDRGGTLHYHDPRLFGRVRLVPGARFDEVPEVADLGPDPLEEGIDAGCLASALARIRRPVKVALMEQSLLPGVGNIYASESCFRARIDPRRPASALSRAEVKRLAGAVLEAMRFGIERQEAPEITYVEEPGSENPFLVYGKAGETCPRCRRGKVERVVQAQRSTFFCPRCQR